jgi:hypothetical protein
LGGEVATKGTNEIVSWGKMGSLRWRFDKTEEIGNEGLLEKM